MNCVKEAQDVSAVNGLLFCDQAGSSPLNKLVLLPSVMHRDKICNARDIPTNGPSQHVSAIKTHQSDLGAGIL
jgi:hypothetical protein